MVQEQYWVVECNEDENFKPDYRFGYNGQHKDNEIRGIGNSLEFEHRGFDSRLARFISTDPLTEKYPWLTPYQFAGNTPIQAKDLEGLEPVIPGRNIILNALGASGNDDKSSRKWTQEVLYPAVKHVAIQAAIVLGTIVLAEIGGAILGPELMEADAIMMERAIVSDATTVAPRAVYAPEIETTTTGAAQLQKLESRAVEGTAVKPVSKPTPKQTPKTGAGRGSNNRVPDPNATGDHSVINKNGNSTFKANPKNPKGYDEVKRTDVKGKAHKNSDNKEIPTPHVHEKGVKDVRPAIKGKDY